MDEIHASDCSFDTFLAVVRGHLPTPSTRFAEYSCHGHNNDKPPGLPQLLEVLRGRTAVTGIRLSGCGIDDESCVQLASALGHNSGLEVLELIDNDIHARGAAALADMLHFENTSLKVLSLEGNPCELEASAVMLEIDRHLQRNRVIRKLSSGPPLPPTPSPAQHPAPPQLAGEVEQAGTGVVAPFAAWPTASAHGTADEPPRDLLEAAGAETAEADAGFAGRVAAPAVVGVDRQLEVELRLQRLEGTNSLLLSEIDHARRLGRQLEAWLQEVHATGDQVAAALAAGQEQAAVTDQRLAALEQWQCSADGASLGLTKVMSNVGLQIHGVVSRLAHLESTVSILAGQQQQNRRHERSSAPAGAAAATSAADQALKPPPPLSLLKVALVEDISGSSPLSARQRAASQSASATGAAAAAATWRLDDDGADFDRFGRPMSPVSATASSSPRTPTPMSPLARGLTPPGGLFGGHRDADGGGQHDGSLMGALRPPPRLSEASGGAHSGDIAEWPVEVFAVSPPPLVLLQHTCVGQAAQDDGVEGSGSMTSAAVAPSWPESSAPADALFSSACEATSPTQAANADVVVQDSFQGLAGGLEGGVMRRSPQDAGGSSQCLQLHALAGFATDDGVRGLPLSGRAAAADAAVVHREPLLHGLVGANGAPATVRASLQGLDGPDVGEARALLQGLVGVRAGPSLGPAGSADAAAAAAGATTMLRGSLQGLAGRLLHHASIPDTARGDDSGAATAASVTHPFAAVGASAASTQRSFGLRPSDSVEVVAPGEAPLQAASLAEASDQELACLAPGGQGVDDAGTAVDAQSSLLPAPSACDATGGTAAVRVGMSNEPSWHSSAPHSISSSPVGSECASPPASPASPADAAAAGGSACPATGAAGDAALPCRLSMGGPSNATSACGTAGVGGAAALDRGLEDLVQQGSLDSCDGALEQQASPTAMTGVEAPPVRRPLEVAVSCGAAQRAEASAALPAAHPALTRRHLVEAVAQSTESLDSPVGGLKNQQPAAGFQAPCADAGRSGAKPLSSAGRGDAAAAAVPSLVSDAALPTPAAASLPQTPVLRLRASAVLAPLRLEILHTPTGGMPRAASAHATPTKLLAEDEDAGVGGAAVLGSLSPKGSPMSPADTLFFTPADAGSGYDGPFDTDEEGGGEPRSRPDRPRSCLSSATPTARSRVVWHDNNAATALCLSTASSVTSLSSLSPAAGTLDRDSMATGASISLTPCRLGRTCSLRSPADCDSLQATPDLRAVPPPAGQQPSGPASHISSLAHHHLALASGSVLSSNPLFGGSPLCSPAPLRLGAMSNTTPNSGDTNSGTAVHDTTSGTAVHDPCGSECGTSVVIGSMTSWAGDLTPPDVTPARSDIFFDADGDAASPLVGEVGFSGTAADVSGVRDGGTAAAQRDETAVGAGPCQSVQQGAHVVETVQAGFIRGADERGSGGDGSIDNKPRRLSRGTVEEQGHVEGSSDARSGVEGSSDVKPRRLSRGTVGGTGRPAWNISHRQPAAGVSACPPASLLSNNNTRKPAGVAKDAVRKAAPALSPLQQMAAAGTISPAVSRSGAIVSWSAASPAGSSHGGVATGATPAVAARPASSHGGTGGNAGGTPVTERPASSHGGAGGTGSTLRDDVALRPLKAFMNSATKAVAPKARMASPGGRYDMQRRSDRDETARSGEHASQPEVDGAAVAMGLPVQRPAATVAMVAVGKHGIDPAQSTTPCSSNPQPRGSSGGGSQPADSLGATARLESHATWGAPQQPEVGTPPGVALGGPRPSREDQQEEGGAANSIAAGVGAAAGGLSPAACMLTPGMSINNWAMSGITAAKTGVPHGGMLCGGGATPGSVTSKEVQEPCVAGGEAPSSDYSAADQRRTGEVSSQQVAAAIQMAVSHGASRSQAPRLSGASSQGADAPAAASAVPGGTAAAGAAAAARQRRAIVTSDHSLATMPTTSAGSSGTSSGLQGGAKRVALRAARHGTAPAPRAQPRMGTGGMTTSRTTGSTGAVPAPSVSHHSAGASAVSLRGGAAGGRHRYGSATSAATSSQPPEPQPPVTAPSSTAADGGTGGALASAPAVGPSGTASVGSIAASAVGGAGATKRFSLRGSTTRRLSDVSSSSQLLHKKGAAVVAAEPQRWVDTARQADNS